jgi:hypothetical protein
MFVNASMCGPRYRIAEGRRPTIVDIDATGAARAMRT